MRTLAMQREPSLFLSLQFTSRKAAEFQCHKCHLDINPDRHSRVIFKDRSYHPDCFTCALCNRILTNADNKALLIYRNGEPLCSRCELAESKTCFGCQKPVLSEKALDFDGKTYHISCFRCGQCKELIMDNHGLHVRDSKPCCDDCYNRLFAPICAECQKPINTGKIATYNAKSYHPDCFRCGVCNQPITEKEFYTKDSKPCCDLCYRDRVAPRCARCSKAVCDPKFTVHDSKTYHLDCFRCGQCNQVISEKEFFTKDGKPCCNLCFRDRFAKRCSHCQKLIVDGKSTIHENNYYHPDCFRCGQCNRVITEREFFTKDGKPCCDTCYRERFATVCSHCRASILDGKSIVYDKKSYHTDCFRCGQCNQVINEKEFYMHEGKPCCNLCYRERVAPLCFKCHQAILGKCSIFEGKNYHAECFTCSKCYRSIGGTERFYSNSSGIVCAKCSSYDR